MEPRTEWGTGGRPVDEGAACVANSGGIRRGPGAPCRSTICYARPRPGRRAGATTPDRARAGVPTVSSWTSGCEPLGLDVVAVEDETLVGVVTEEDYRVAERTAVLCPRWRLGRGRSMARGAGGLGRNHDSAVPGGGPLRRATPPRRRNPVAAGNIRLAAAGLASNIYPPAVEPLACGQLRGRHRVPRPAEPAVYTDARGSSAPVSIPREIHPAFSPTPTRRGR
ncbi:hypothetical protein LV779_13930 [Streptomyces thinghirensis]|nr:hypothetical protein [Streptomyces thinghirensis]